jgi:penicillin-binding protein 2
MVAPTEDRRRISARIAVLQVGVIIWFAALGICFWVLQVVQTEKFVEMANSNYQRNLSLRAPRGFLFDRNGRILVENRDSLTISIDRELTKDLPRTVQIASQLLGLDPAQVQQTVDRHVRFLREPVYQPIVIVTDATLEQASRVRLHQRELPELDVETVPTRQYPSDALAAHLFGYVAQADEEQVKDLGLSRNAIVGKSGVEKIYNTVLMGEDGARSVVVNSMGREIRELDEILPTEGRRVQLTIDYDLQKAAEDGFRHEGFNGAALIMDPRNGEVLVHASVPGYDPNDFAAGVKSATWTALTTDKLKPLTNRVLQGRYSPGSTFKIVVATAAMEEGLVDSNFRVTCTGGKDFYGRYYKCHKKGGHGSIDMRHALEKSCNVYFYTLGEKLGVDRIYKWAEKLGLAGKTGIDLPNEIESIVPSTEWKLKRTGERWYPGETISVAIGQGQVTVTPASLANMIATVANGGTRVTPHVVKAVDEGKGWKPVPLAAVANKVAFRPDTLAALHDGLWMVVNAAGTGSRGRVEGRDVSGKTGTAQVISNEGKARARNSGRDLRDHGWFVFFAPKDNPEIAGVIFGEHNEHGFLGAPIAKHVIETYFAKKEGKPLPVLEKKGAPQAPDDDDPDSPPALPPVEVASVRANARTAAE